MTETVYFRDSGTPVSGNGSFQVSGFTGKSMGQTIVYYCDNTEGLGTYYTTGDFEFYVNQ